MSMFPIGGGFAGAGLASTAVVITAGNQFDYTYGYISSGPIGSFTGGPLLEGATLTRLATADTGSGQLQITFDGDHLDALNSFTGVTIDGVNTAFADADIGPRFISTYTQVVWNNHSLFVEGNTYTAVLY